MGLSKTDHNKTSISYAFHYNKTNSLKLKEYVTTVSTSGHSSGKYKQEENESCHKSVCQFIRNSERVLHLFTLELKYTR